jgi:hypothetical protein
MKHDPMDRYEQEYKEAEDYLITMSSEFEDDIPGTMLSFRQETLDEIVDLFIRKTQNRRCYKKWEYEMMRLCGWEYVDREGWSECGSTSKTHNTYDL